MGSSESTMSTNVIHLAEYDHESDMKPNRQHQDDVNLENDDESTCSASCFGAILWILSILMILCTFPVSMLFCIRIVQEFERAVIFRLGRVRRNGTVGPGLFFIVPCLDQVSTVPKGPQNLFLILNLDFVMSQKLPIFPTVQWP